MRAAVPGRIHSIAIRFILPLAGALALVGSMAAATSPATSTAVPGRFLLGVSATSASNAWAVGFIGGSPQQTLIQHWNGTAWKQAATPDPGPVGNILGGVSAVSASDAWAVGGAYLADGTTQKLVLHWNGRAWKQVTVPGPPGGLDAVIATPPPMPGRSGARRYCTGTARAGHR